MPSPYRRCDVGREGEIMLGEASHICAAAPGGPRYDPGMSETERRSSKNGIWMCKLHGTSVDSHDPKFSIELLRSWKMQAEERSHRSVLYGDAGWPAKVSEGEPAKRLYAAAVADIDALRRSDKWPSTDVALTVQMKELVQPTPTTALAHVLSRLGDLVLVAPPGMGKTSTLLQVAEGLVAHGETPVFVPLADWATENKPLLDSILGRSTFRGKITEDDFRAVAQKTGVYLLLDGWNELDGKARRRATAELKRLQIDSPQLGLLYQRASSRSTFPSMARLLSFSLWVTRSRWRLPEHCAAKRASELSMRRGARRVCANWLPSRFT